MSEIRFVRDDGAVPSLQPGHHAYRIENDRGHLLGIVASGESGGRVTWTAARLHPSRTLRFGQPMVFAESRKAAAERLVRGRP